MYARKVDKNQAEIVKSMREFGAKVLICSHIGNGFPDLMVFYNDRTYFMEIKNLETGYGKKGLNGKQRAWEKTTGQVVHVITCSEDAIYFLEKS